MNDGLFIILISCYWFIHGNMFCYGCMMLMRDTDDTRSESHTNQISHDSTITWLSLLFGPFGTFLWLVLRLFMQIIHKRRPAPN